MDTKLSAEQVSELKEAFSLFDKNGDGHITADELGQVMEQLGHVVEEEDLEEMIHEVDPRKQGDIDFADFLKMMDQDLAQPNDEMKIAFAFFDKDKDGFISPAELKALMTSLGEKVGDNEIEAIIEEHDTDKDGKLNLEEFKGMYATKTSG
mmetsp:Transcript_20554/g.36519  ORF Transcript_20554/g.36519 Transcript_20554/m.36519 type:complete len:151 (+) Transcript_20554:27-479(+)